MSAKTCGGCDYWDPGKCREANRELVPGKAPERPSWCPGYFDVGSLSVMELFERAERLCPGRTSKEEAQRAARNAGEL